VNFISAIRQEFTHYLKSKFICVTMSGFMTLSLTDARRLHMLLSSSQYEHFGFKNK